MSKRILTLLCSLAFVAACGPKVSIAPESKNSLGRVIAVLPVRDVELSSRERGDYIRKTLVSELRNRGFFVLDESITSKYCKVNPCSGAGELAKKYPVDAFIDLSVDSISRYSFLAGYYNAIGGMLRVVHPSGKELVSIAHTQRERGGVLFESGQVFEAIAQQYRNSGDDAFNTLAHKFVRNLVEPMPIVSNAANQQSLSEVVLNEVFVKSIKGAVVEICATGTPKALATVSLSRFPTNLREVSPGKYCGVYRLAGSKDQLSNSSVELRSPLGVSARKELDLGEYGICEFHRYVKLEAASTPKISFQCEASECSEEAELCRQTNFLVYRAQVGSDVFAPIATFTGTEWFDRNTKPEEKYRYQIIAENLYGVRSRPVEITSQGGA